MMRQPEQDSPNCRRLAETDEGRANDCWSSHKPVATPSPGVSRRVLLKSLLSTAVAATTLENQALALFESQPRNLIDFHIHTIPDFFLKERDRVYPTREKLAGMSMQWTRESMLEDMEKGGIATALLSVHFEGFEGVAPAVRGTKWSAEESRVLARKNNEFHADMVRDYPTKFGFFGVLPLPHIDNSLKEIAYALDVLKADGVEIMTSYEGKYLGEKMYFPIWEELNRRKAVAFIHPVTAPCCQNLVPLLPDFMIEGPQDTCRTILSLALSGVYNRFPDIKFIFSHGGGSMPMFAGRIQEILHQPVRKEYLEEHFPGGIYETLKRNHYETSDTSSKASVAAILDCVPASQVLMGSGYPYFPISNWTDQFRKLPLTRAQKRAIERDNALSLLPRLA